MMRGLLGGELECGPVDGPGVTWGKKADLAGVGFSAKGHASGKRAKGEGNGFKQAVVSFSGEPRWWTQATKSKPDAQPLPVIRAWGGNEDPGRKKKDRPNEPWKNREKKQNTTYRFVCYGVSFSLKLGGESGEEGEGK